MSFKAPRNVGADDDVTVIDERSQHIERTGGGEFGEGVPEAGDVADTSPEVNDVFDHESRKVDFGFPEAYEGLSKCWIIE